MKDICVIQEDTVNSLALIGETLGAANINIEGLSLTTCNNQNIIHLAVEDAESTQNALEKSGIVIKKETEVFVLHKDTKRVTGKPGSFGGICKLFAQNAIKINFGYPAENNRYIFGVDNVEKAKELLG